MVHKQSHRSIEPNRFKNKKLKEKLSCSKRTTNISETENHTMNIMQTVELNQSESTDSNISQNQVLNEYFEEDDMKDENLEEEEEATDLLLSDMNDAMIISNELKIEATSSHEKFSTSLISSELNDTTNVPLENTCETYLCSINSCTYFTKEVNEDLLSEHFQDYHPEVDATERKFIEL